MTLSTVACSGGTAATDSSALTTRAIEELLVSADEVKIALDWEPLGSESKDDLFATYTSTEVQGLLDQFGDSAIVVEALGEECAAAVTERGVILGGPVGAEAIVSGSWVERDVTVRDMILAQFDERSDAQAYVDAIPELVEACPNFNLFPGGRAMTLVTAEDPRIVGLQADDSYSYLVGYYGNYVAQVEVGIGDGEFASGESLLILQLDKLASLSGE